MRAALRKVQSNLQDDVARAVGATAGRPPGDAGIGEPFTTTVTVSLVFALILSLPFLLMQAYAFLVPALEPEQQPQVKRVTLAVPGLFVAGAAFGYFVVLPAAVHFFQNFNSDQFNVLVQASQYYKFAATTILAMGLLFQVPVAILAITRAGVITPRQLRRNRRYAIAACGRRRRSCPATRSRCCSRRCRCTCCSSSACCWPISPTGGHANGHCNPGPWPGSSDGPGGAPLPAEPRRGTSRWVCRGSNVNDLH